MNYTESEDFPSLIYPTLQMTTSQEVTFTASFVLIQDESSKSTLITVNSNKRQQIMGVVDKINIFSNCHVY